MGYTATYPRQRKTHPTAKNRVWGFFADPNKTRPANRRQPAEPRRKIDPTTTKPVSGVFFYGYRFYDATTGRWPSRDLIGEGGGVNLYGFVANDGVNNWDLLGNSVGGGLAITETVPFMGYCGSFAWTVFFHWFPTPKNSGVILQTVETDIKYQEYDTNGFLKKGILTDNPTDNPYNEIWDVAGKRSGSADDTFHFKQKLDPLSGRAVAQGHGLPNTVGTATFTGWARFYPNIKVSEKLPELQNAGWKKGNPNTWAGSNQWSGKINPGWNSAGATGSTLKMHTITVKWDCCKKENLTELVSKYTEK